MEGVVLVVLVMLGGALGAPTPPRTLLILRESIRLLSSLQDTQVSCDTMKVTNVFAGDKPDPILHTLCKATTVTLQGRSCHRALEGLYLNLLQLIPKGSSAFQVPCPVTGSSTTSLSHFLLDLRRLLQQIVKEERLQ